MCQLSNGSCFTYSIYTHHQNDIGGGSAIERQILRYWARNIGHQLSNLIRRLFTGKRQIDAAFLDELEEVLLTSDVGVETTVQIIENLEKRVSKEAYVSQDELHELLADEIAKLMPDISSPVAQDLSLNGASTPYVVLVVGVNGVGKKKAP